MAGQTADEWAAQFRRAEAAEMAARVAQAFAVIALNRDHGISYAKLAGLLRRPRSTLYNIAKPHLPTAGKET